MVLPCSIPHSCAFPAGHNLLMLCRMGTWAQACPRTHPVPMQDTAVVETGQSSPHLFVPVISGIPLQWFVLSLIFKVASTKQKELPDLNSNSSLLLLSQIVRGNGASLCLSLWIPDSLKYFQFHPFMEPESQTASLFMATF